MKTLDAHSTLIRLNKPTEYNSYMEKLNCLNWKAGISLVSYGVRIGIRVNVSTVLEHIPDFLPPGWEPSSSPVVDELYSLIVAEITPGLSSGDYHQLYREQERLAHTISLDEVFDTLDSDLRLQVGMSARHRLFVHAGVVGWRGRAIVIPGRSFSGKTTLVEALVKAGATYYSDEYAVLDTDGFVHPYPRPLAIRQEAGQRVKKCSVEELGGKSGIEPLPVGLVIHTKYQSGTPWHPHVISLGQAVLALLDNTIVARTRPEFALPILPRAVSGALTLKGKRGEAQDVAITLLRQLEDWIGN